MISKAWIIGLGIAAVAIIGIVSTISWVVGIYNTNIEYSNQYEAQHKVVETTMDKMRKDLCNQYKVSQEFADTFIKVVASQAEGRKGGSVFKMVTEASGAPQTFTPEISAKMMNTISGNLAEYKRSQDTFIDIWRVQKTFCEQVPNCLLIGSKVKPEPKVISSDTVKQAMETGKLEDKLL